MKVFFSISFVYCSTCSVSILIWLSLSCIPYKILLNITCYFFMDINIHFKSKEKSRSCGFFQQDYRIYFLWVKTMSFTTVYISIAPHNVRYAAVTLIQMDITANILAKGIPELSNINGFIWLLSGYHSSWPIHYHLLPYNTSFKILSTAIVLIFQIVPKFPSLFWTMTTKHRW